MSEHFMHVGKDFEVPDGRAKVTGRAKYADDYLFENLLHAKTVKSPYAHARVRSIDTSGAEAMSGVRAVITYEDAPQPAVGQPALDSEPKVFGTPVAAVAAVDEYTAAAAVEEIDVEYEVLDHVVDPVETLKPGSPNARSEGNVPTGEAEGESAEGQGGEESAPIETIKWDGADFSTRFPTNPGEYTVEWEVGDVESALSSADLVIEDTVEAHPQVNNPMEPRSNAALSLIHIFRCR
jgi:xanthine dehydrogenase molybdenum-binding subunit